MRLLTALMLFALWLALSATAAPGHLALGAVLACLIAWMNPAVKRQRKLSLPAALAYQPWLLARILKSGLHVSRVILSPSLPIAPKVLRHSTRLRSDGELVALGNSITLTPGTVTIDIAPGEVLVHALDEASAQDLLSGRLEGKLRRVFNTPEAPS
ncbi:MAG: Na+/H+ antiporter subunit E [Halieaceae bacterium]|jgi:multicomponent Na+:H+ antiporter subunit E|nr:Na+/H+ antiporter subunit E [Halieaceae bacterium]